uniref:RING-type E3 ubiquitin transferase n=2 Tax=Moniliophthora roreri TaxID=221103 RepID=A0A0W0F5D3_MONRR
MPSTLPPLLMLRQLAQQLFWAILFALRALIVGCIWLAVVPLLTIWSWRMYFSLGENTAWYISDRPRPALHPSPQPNANPNISLSFPLSFSLYYHLSSPPLPPSSPSDLTWTWTDLFNHPLWLSLSSDIFTGQIIASLVVLTFVAIFLLREWIAQNARPGVFDDDPAPAPAAGAVLDVPQGARGAQAQRVLDVNARLALAQRQFDALRALDAMHAGEGGGGGVGVGVPVNLLEHPANDDRFAALRARRRNQPQNANPNANLAAIEQEERERNQIRQERIRRRNFARRLHAARVNGRVSRRGAPMGAGAGAGAPADPFDLPPENEEPQKKEEKTQVQANFFPDVQPQLSRPGTSLPFSFTFKSKTEHGEEGVGVGVGPSYTGANFSASLSGSSSASVSPVPSFSASPSTSTSASPPPFAIPGLSNTNTNTNTTPTTSTPTTPLRRPPLPVSTPLATPTASYRAPEDMDVEEEYFGISRHKGKGKGKAEDEDEETWTEVEVKEEVEVDDEIARAAGVEGGDAKVIAIPHLTEYGDLLYGPGSGQAGDVQEEFGKYFVERERAEEDEDTEEAVRQQDGAVPIHGQDSETEDDEESEDDIDERIRPERRDRPRNRAIEAIMDVDADSDTEDEEDEEAPFVDEEHEHEQPNAADGGAAGGGGGFDIDMAALAINQNLNQNQNQNPNPAPDVNDDFPPELADDLEPGVEDDMDGAMEAIGLRGPPWGVLQNAALLIFLLDLAIGLGVCLPYTIGKSTALISLNPKRLLFLAHLPVRAIRIVTDPIVDAGIWVVWRVLGRIWRVFEMILVSGVVGGVFGVQGEEKVKGAFERVWGLVEGALSFSSSPVTETVTALEPTKTAAPVIVSWSERIPVPWDVIEPYFTPLGAYLRSTYTSLRDLYISFALNDGPYERVLSVFLGYVIIGVVLGLYLRVNVRNAGRAVRSAVRQQLLVVKVATFIVIELVIFPFCCGVVLSICSVLLGLFKEASMRGRIEFFKEAPLTAMFWHWIGGTMFMYSFAVLLSGCRTIMRPGAMWFIKDPQDTNSHPIRDILDRPTLVQLRKILVSGVMYSFVVVCAVGSVAGLMYAGRWALGGSKNTGGVGLRWRNREPLSTVPIDLLFLHFVLPYTMTYFRPRKPLKKLALMIWRALAARFRLSSYFFGGRYPNEEYTPEHFSFLPLTLLTVKNGGKEDEENPIRQACDGTFRRVPATDHIALPRDMRATVPVTPTGQPVDDKAKLLMLAQDAETLKAKRSIANDYIIVYLPPFFRYRVMGFICCLWIVGAACVGLAIGVPIILGRAVLASVLGGKAGEEVHDGYAILVGFYLLWGCFLVGKAVDRLDKRRQRRGTEGPRAHLAVLVVKRGLLWLVKTGYMILMLGVVIPAFVGVVIELYLVLPVRLWGGLGSAEEAVRIRIVDEWALGLLYMKIGMNVMRGVRAADGQNTIGRGIARIKHNGWTHPDPVLATKEVILPLCGGLLAMILLPGVAFRALQYLVPVLETMTNDRFMFTHIYPGIFLCTALGRSSLMLRGVVANWSQAVRDKEFLVEMRLKNLDETEKEKGKEREKEVGLEA